MKDNEKLYKVYHRNYQTIDELYDDLSDVVLNIILENNKVVIHYDSDTLEIQPSPYGYYTYLNGEKEKGEWEDQDIYFYVLEFIHEQRKDLSEVEIYDTSIIDINDSGITYIDQFNRKHFVNYAACAVNGPNASCVAEIDITKWYFRFFTSGVSIKLVFRNPFVFKKRNHFLVGGKAKRFSALQQAVIDSGYTTYDLS